MTSHYKLFNANCTSVVGVNKKHNQDACIHKETTKYFLAVVADGVGSAINSHIGSNQALNAVQKAIVQWRSLKRNNNAVLIQLIHFYWNLLIHDLNYERKDCSTTCLFVYVEKDTQNTLIGKLGDGMIFLKSNKDQYMNSRGLDFNYTQALGSSKNIKDWQIETMNIDFENMKLFLATDGISDDIVENKEEDFLDYLISSIEDSDNNKRSFLLRKIFKNWPTKFHSDDKTICVVWSKK